MPRRKRYNDESKAYMAEVGNYLGKVARGRSVRQVDPNQPAFSEEAETIRQTKKLDEANAYDRMLRQR